MTKKILRSLLVLAAVGVSGLIGCGDQPEPGTLEEANGLSTGTALFVVGNTTLGAGDQAISQRLRAAGLTVVVKRDSAAATGDASGKQLVVISSTVTSGLVGAKFTTVGVPVLAWESAVFDDLKMTAARAGTDFGTVTSQRALVIAAPATDPMAAGLTGNQTVVSAASTLSWGRPGSAAVVVAQTATDATRSTIFRYEKGSSMVGLNAPERRVGFMLEDATASLLTAAGQALTDAAIRWAAHLEPACTPGARRCASANTAQTCDATGNWSSTTTCPFVCSAGACTGVCVPGATRCSGNTVQTCSNAGTWQSTSTCSVSCSAGACVPGGVCGNGVLEGSETCDDGNTNSGDGCSATCIVEAGFICSMPGQPCQRFTVCGNGVLEGSETCDDGNTNSGDGCSATCIVEAGFICSMPGQPCQRFAVCGNGVLEAGESCDDGNTNSGDGCSATCLIEPHAAR